MKKKEIIKNVIKNRRTVPEPDHRDLGAILLFIFLLPYIVSFFFGNAGMEQESRSSEESEYVVCNTTGVGTEMIPLENYLIRRLPATIDTNYEPETLKAQAVVLRTELMRLYYDSQSDYGASQDAGSSSDYGGTRQKDDENKKYIYIESNIAAVDVDNESYEKCRTAVESTAGMYMTYEGYPVKAPYFAVSAGATRNGNEVFNSEDYAYLKSVMCERDFTAENYVQSVKVNKSTFYERLRTLYSGIAEETDDAGDRLSADEFQTEGFQADGLSISDFQIHRDRAGYVKEIGIGEKYISGEVFRDEFLLNSSCFELEESGSTVMIRTKGVGHGLGLCQYGANEAAKKGSDFIDILNYFFSDIVIEKTE